jgi:hypothetical protein
MFIIIDIISLTKYEIFNAAPDKFID